MGGTDFGAGTAEFAFGFDDTIVKVQGRQGDTSPLFLRNVQAADRSGGADLAAFNAVELAGGLGKVQYRLGGMFEFDDACRTDGGAGLAPVQRAV
jgi:hypothetical protein